MRSLLERITGRILKFLTSRVFFVTMILFCQLVILLLFVLGIGAYYRHIATALNVLNIILLMRVINRYYNTSYKLAWALIIGVLPLCGGLLYLMFAEKKVPKDLRGRILQGMIENKNILKENEDIAIEDGVVRQLYEYIKNNGFY